MLEPASIPIESVGAIALFVTGHLIESLSAVALEILLETLYKLITSYETHLCLHIVHLFGLDIRASHQAQSKAPVFGTGKF